MLSYFRGYIKESIVAPAFKMLEALFDLFIPLVMAAIINIGIANNNTNYIIRQCGLLILLGVIGLACSVIAQYFASKAAVGYSTNLRRSFFIHIQSLGFSEMDTIGTNTLITRMTSDINQIQTGINLFLRLFLRSPFIVLGALVMAFKISKDAGIIFTITIPILSVVVFGIMVYTMPLYKKVQEKLDQLLGITRENLSGVRVIRAFNKEESEVSQFESTNHEFTRLQKRVGNISGLMNPFTYVIINVAIIAILNTGAINVNLGTLKQGDVIALISYMGHILIELIKLANLIIQMTKAVASGRRVHDILNTEPSMEFGALENKESSVSNDDAIRFENVWLSYSSTGENSLNNINFSVKKGQTIGIIGGTGSGKTSIVNLIPRFYDATSGTVNVFGRSVKEYTKEGLRNLIGIVMQKTLLFKGTIRSNLHWGNENATDEEIWHALAVAQADDFVRKKKNGLDEPVEQGGRNLSGGQRQRIAIARAIVKNPKILILDDSTSALDFATDAALRKALRNLPDDMTVIIVSQRTSSIQHADQILVLDDGYLVGVGKHDALLKTCDVYDEIYQSQYKKGGEE